MKDEADSFESSRDMAEYQTSFLAPAAVGSARKTREDRATLMATEDDGGFLLGIEKLFGRTVGAPAANANLDAGNIDSIIGHINAMKDQIPYDPSKNYKYWATINLE